MPWRILVADGVHLQEELFGEVGARFRGALARAFPEHPPEVLALRFQFAVGSLVHVMSGHLPEAPLLQAGARHRSGAADLDAHVMRDMVTFLAAGIRAPVAEAP